MRPLKQQLLAVTDAFERASGLSRPRVSTLIFNDGKVLDRLHADSDLTTGRLERAFIWLSCNWPDCAEWPPGITRPAAPAPRSAA